MEEAKRLLEEMQIQFSTGENEELKIQDKFSFIDSLEYLDTDSQEEELKQYISILQEELSKIQTGTIDISRIPKTNRKMLKTIKDLIAYCSNLNETIATSEEEKIQLNEEITSLKTSYESKIDVLKTYMSKKYSTMAGELEILISNYNAMISSSQQQPISGILVEKIRALELQVEALKNSNSTVDSSGTCGESLNLLAKLLLISLKN